jgi:hypothetical protein
MRWICPRLANITLLIEFIRQHSSGAFTSNAVEEVDMKELSFLFTTTTTITPFQITMAQSASPLFNSIQGSLRTFGISPSGTCLIYWISVLVLTSPSVEIGVRAALQEMAVFCLHDISGSNGAFQMGSIFAAVLEMNEIIGRLLMEYRQVKERRHRNDIGDADDGQRVSHDDSLYMADDDTALYDSVKGKACNPQLSTETSLLRCIHAYFHQLKLKLISEMGNTPFFDHLVSAYSNCYKSSKKPKKSV